MYQQMCTSVECAKSVYLSLSDDVWLAVLIHLDAKSLCSISQTCYVFYQLAADRSLWNNLLQNERKRAILVPGFVEICPKSLFRFRKDFDCINDAMKAADPKGRDKIFLAAGVYKESLVIDKCMDIIGEGSMGAAVIEGSTSNTVMCTAPDGSLSNVALRQTGHWFCLDVEKGSFEIKGCDISNRTLSAVKIGKDASPVISGNKIHDTNEAGVAIFGGCGIIENNEFFRNRFGSIEVVYPNAAPIVRRNVIHHNRGYGIHVHTNSKAIIHENTIYENGSDGISCWGAAEPIVSRNRIYGNRGDGIYIHEDGKGTFEHNEIYKQKLDGIRTSRSNPTISDNSVYGNEGDGLRVVMGANPVIRGNKIYDNNRVGVHIYREARGLCVDNWISGNRNAGVQIYGGSRTKIANNIIQRNKCSGLYVSDRATVEVENNEICDNGDCGMELVSGIYVDVCEGNSVHHNKTAGIAVYQDTYMADLCQVNNVMSNGSLDDDGVIIGGGGDVIVRGGRAVYPKCFGSKDRDRDEIEVVSFLVEKAILAKRCTFAYTREYYHAQYWYECRTCSSPRQIQGRPEVSVCEQCAKVCHAGHELSPRKFGHFYCDCGQGQQDLCKCSASPHA